MTRYHFRRLVDDDLMVIVELAGERVRVTGDKGAQVFALPLSEAAERM